MPDFKIKGLQGRKVLVTGGNGFIGSNLSKRCLELGADVTILTNSQEKMRNVRDFREKLGIIVADITDAAQVEEAVKGRDLVFHLAGQIIDLVSMQQPHLDIDINCHGCINILEAIKKFNTGAKLVFAGTAREVGPAQKIPVDESPKEFPPSIYDADKLACENYLRIYNRHFGLRTTTLRLANVFGERQQVVDFKSGVLNHMIKRAMTGETITIYGNGEARRDYNYVQNVVDAFLLASQSKKTDGEHYLVATGRGVSFKDMCHAVNDTVKGLTGKSTEIKHVPFPGDAKKVDIGDFIGDASKFKEASGWFPRVSFEEGLKRTVLFYKERLQEYLQ